MKLLEHTGKDMFRKAGIPTPEGVLIYEKSSLSSISFPFPWVMKAQVLVGGRGKAGGIKFASNVEEAEHAFESMMAMTIKGERIKKILVEQKLTIQKECYLSFILDRSSRQYLMMFSYSGGIDIESLKDKIIKISINPIAGFQGYQLRKLPRELRDIAQKLFTLFVQNDCELAEINPLAITDHGPMAADAKIIIDNNALYRHIDVPQEDTELTTLEKEAREKNIAFVQLDGNIGVIANGAGLTMATLDALNEFNGKGGVFLDLGGTDDPSKVKEAFELITKAQPTVIFLNLFGGITKCDTVAQGIIDFIKENEVACPVVARIKGMNEEQARKMLKEYVIPVDSFEDAAKKAAELGGV